ncbi:unnamed protein product [Diatraea saccharalis]|uniref:Uncharacterized protein n=1 Tax=Diatraea saccharalis TaxID=40085 RepID=A0A9N9R1J8_9NEOP|nr:unnamed protein product [Diatraea saccharalis]
MLPVFTQDMNNLALSESTPVGSIVYTLQGVDPEGLPLKYNLIGTNKFEANPVTGQVTLIRPLDRETEDTIKFLVSIEDQNPDSAQNLMQLQPVTVIVLDENDNPPMFKNNPYEVDVPEDEEIGKTILTNIQVEDIDSVGDSLEVGCLSEQWPEACETFEVVMLSSSASHYTGALVLKKTLNYNEKQFYQFQLYATDGTLNSSAHVEVKVVDVQNSPPVFSGALTGALAEDAPVGTLALTIKARDADRAQPRDVILELVTNPLDFFVLDSATGELRTAKPLDREALADPSSPLNLTIKATEIVNGTPLYSDLTSTVAMVTVTIKDVNDEPPRFNHREYFVDIPESLPVGTPLPNLDMTVTDTDLGLNSVFSLRLSDEMGAFIVEPATATGSASVTLRLNSSLDYEDPNQRKFILEVIAEELHTSPRLSSKASVTISLIDVNDNAPQFAEEPYPATVAEASPAGTRVAVVKATDRDTGRFGTDGIVYELSGNGAELFRVDNRTGLITVAPCPTPGLAPCLDYETRKDYFLQYKATDDDGSGQMTVVSLQISLIDSNDNPPTFATPVYKASIDEDAVKFEPELQVQARDVDVSSEIRYSIIEPAIQPFWIDPLTGRISVRPETGGVTQNGDDNKIVLTILATDGIHNATCKVEITVRDVNNHAPVFDIDKYDADIPEDAPIGTEVAAVRATDLDSGINAEIKYGIQKGAQEAFLIDNVTGVVTVSAALDYDKRNTYKIQIIASDLGMPSLTGTTELTVHVINVNDKKPSFTPPVQRAEVSADAEIGTVVHNLIAVDPDITDNSLLVYEMLQDRVIKAVDKNGKEVSDEGIFGSWFAVQPNGSVIVAQKLDRGRAAVLTLPVAVTDASALTLQQTEAHRDALHRKTQNSQDNEILKISYRRYRNFCNDLLKRLKNEYEKSEINKCKNPKQTWKTIRKFTNTIKETNHAEELLHSNSSCPQTSINLINEYFSNVGKNLASEIDKSAVVADIPCAIKSNNHPNSFVLLPTDNIEITNLIQSLKNDSATGSDNIPSAFLKATAKSIVPILTHIFNICFNNGVFPKCFKQSIVHPIHRGGSGECVDNFRPISVLTALSKILEKLINSRLMNYLKQENLISSSQFGFQPNKSTEDAVAPLVDNVATTLDHGDKCIGVFLDLAKAFDTVSTPILLNKLESVGIRGMPLKLFKSFLTNRKQRVRIGAFESIDMPITCGVAQGSVLGPSLFLVYINELCDYKPINSSIFSYADDTAIIFRGETWASVKQVAERALTNITNWLFKNYLTLNITKSKFLSFSITNNSKPDPSYCIKIYTCNQNDPSSLCNCLALERVNHIKYLGIQLDSTLNWDVQIAHLSSRTRKLIWTFKKLGDVLKPSSLKSIYLALAQSILSYCISVWGGACKTKIIKLERAQRSILKVMSKKPYRYPTTILYRNCAVLSIRQLFILHAILYKHSKVPYDRNSSISRKRRTDRVFVIATHRTTFVRRHLCFLAPYLYNKINRILNIHNKTRYNCKSTLEKWLLTLNYTDTESLLISPR